MSEVRVTTRRPSAPDDADFAIEIDFQKGSGSPQRVFRAADKMVQALQRLDEALCVSVDTNIKPVLMLEDIEAGSIRIWLKNILVAVDDQAIKDLDWKPAVGRYLVRAKYAYIRWANKSYPEKTLVELAQELCAIAGETDIKHLPDYAPPSTAELAEAAKEIDAAKAELSDGDRITYLTEENEAIDFDLAVSWSVEELSDLLVRETTKFENMPMNMIVKRPDYLGVSKWEFRHGRKPISARIEHESWLADFQDRKIDIRPGDALKCLVTIEYAYGFDNELVSETYTVTTVEAVLVNQIRQASFLQNED